MCFHLPIQNAGQCCSSFEEMQSKRTLNPSDSCRRVVGAQTSVFRVRCRVGSSQHIFVLKSEVGVCIGFLLLPDGLRSRLAPAPVNLSVVCG